jgi:photosystem II stability/assembly factor-like uncharacterized protein
MNLSGILLALISILMLLGCRKESENVLTTETIQTGYEGKINDIEVNDFRTIVCGGIRGVEGVILEKEVDSETWVVKYKQPQRSFYSLLVSISGEIWCGGEFLYIVKSDALDNWTHFSLDDQVPFHEEDRPSIRKMVNTEISSFSFVGGENLGEGVLYRSNDDGENWQFDFMQHELRDLCWLNPNHGIIVGHGILAHVDSSLQIQSYSGNNYEFYTGIEKDNSGNLIVITQSGTMFFSNNQGYEWQKLETNLNGNYQSIALNDIEIRDGNYVVCGNSGIALFSTNGINWNEFQIENESNLYSVTLHQNQCYFTSDQGKIFRSTIP